MRRFREVWKKLREELESMQNGTCRSMHVGRLSTQCSRVCRFGRPATGGIDHGHRTADNPSKTTPGSSLVFFSHYPPSLSLDDAELPILGVHHCEESMNIMRGFILVKCA